MLIISLSDVYIHFNFVLLYYCCHSDKTLKGLYKILHASLTHRTHLQGPVCIVLDDLSTLLSVRVQYRDIKNFVRYCHQFFTGSNPLTDVS